MAFTTPGTKAIWANPGANDPAPANRQAGGWYYNPQSGSVDQWFPDAAGTAANLPSTEKTGSSDYFGQAMNLLQPGIAAQTKPLTDLQSAIPTIYQQAGYDVGAQQKAQLGSQRAQAARMGVSSTSGVEQSQEANIAQGWSRELAKLPVAQAQSLIQIGSQIAAIQGQGQQAAMQYASDMAKMVSEQEYRNKLIQLKLLEIGGSGGNPFNTGETDTSSSDPLGLGLNLGGADLSGLDLSGGGTADASGAVANPLGLTL